MFIMRRYSGYLIIAAIFVLALTFWRDNIIASTQRSLNQHGLSTPHASEKPAEPPQDGRFHWETVPVLNSVTSLTPLPTEEPKQLPKVQHDFPIEASGASIQRKERLSAVKQTFERCWKAYKEHAWLKDELAPISGGTKNGFGGWGANLVDNLDTLWIMDMKNDFEEAVQAAVSIDLRFASIDRINVFETTIRHLGGILAAYDLSNDKRLLNKALEVGEMLLHAFDTPNRMPITRWNTEICKAGGKQVADDTVLVAEIGSLSMEFTHLSQLTGDMRFYDATDRITKLFEAQQDRTHLPGMWPVLVNAKEQIFNADTFFTLSAMSDSVYEVSRAYREFFS